MKNHLWFSTQVFHLSKPIAVNSGRLILAKSHQVYHCPDAVQYSPIVQSRYQCVQDLYPKYDPITRSKTFPKAYNKWSYNLVLDPWYHFPTSSLIAFVDERGNGPRWTSIFEFKSFVMEWQSGWPLTKLATRYGISLDAVRALFDNLNKGKIVSPLAHFAERLLNNSPIIRPDIFIPNPFSPDELGYIKGSYAFYRIPGGYIKDTGIPLYFCPQFTESAKLINGQVLLWLFSEEVEFMYHAYKASVKHNETWDNIVYDNGFTAGYKYTQIKTLDQYRYAIFEGLRVGPTVDYDNDIDDYSEVKQSVNALAHTPLVVPWDSDIPGDNSNIRNSCVRLYNGIWVEDYIKRTMWDQCTEHSLVLFSNALHDRAKKHINIRNGTMSSGHSPHLCRRDYLTSPLNLTQAIASIKGTPNNNTHNTIPSIFNYIIRFNLKTNKIVPFTDDYCVVLEEERMIEVKGMWLKFTESQWLALSNALMLAQLLQV